MDPIYANKETLFAFFKDEGMLPWFISADEDGRWFANVLTSSGRILLVRGICNQHEDRVYEIHDESPVD